MLKDVKGIIKNYLTARDLTALISEDGKCGCPIEDIIACDSFPGRCRPAYWMRHVVKGELKWGAVASGDGGIGPFEGMGMWRYFDIWVDPDAPYELEIHHILRISGETFCWRVHSIKSQEGSSNVLHIHAVAAPPHSYPDWIIAPVVGSYEYLLSIHISYTDTGAELNICERGTKHDNHHE